MHNAELSILLHRALEARVGVLLDALAVPGWQQAAEPLHEVRVASRRLRAVLDLVDPGLYPAFKRQQRRLKRLTRALGLTRELDVHLGLLEDLERTLPQPEPATALEHALEAVAKDLDRARSALARDLERVSLKGLATLLEVPSLPNPFAGADLAQGIWGCLEPGLRSATEAIAGLLDQEDPPALHALRIRIKRLRYALEILAPGFPSRPEAQLRHLKALQGALGNHHDRATLEAFLQDLDKGLAQRNRVHLARGLQAGIALLGEERLLAFEHFRALALGQGLRTLTADLKRDLGLTPDPEGNDLP